MAMKKSKIDILECWRFLIALVGTIIAGAAMVFVLTLAIGLVSIASSSWLLGFVAGLVVLLVINILIEKITGG
jgi:uncharacterized membrane protein